MKNAANRLRHFCLFVLGACALVRGAPEWTGDPVKGGEELEHEWSTLR